MQDRHKNNELYFQELAEGTRKYVIPYIESVKKIPENAVVLEVGCGQGGNLCPFLEMGCKVIGIDKNDDKMEYANSFFRGKNTGDITLLNNNFYEIDPAALPKANLVLIRDVLEHITDKELFFEKLHGFLADGAVIFVAFPPWRMPFGGHQQGCQSKLLSKTPWFHLLPWPVFEFMLKAFGESKDFIRETRGDVYKTRLSISRYKKLLKKAGFKIEKETYYMVNPSYKIKFGLNPTVLPAILKIPFVCDFYTTAHYSVIAPR
jgi:2-polyprenyl-3-methyl-5-hydroxy-6-metoxy-1,4-benzoquinol methylase